MHTSICLSTKHNSTVHAKRTGLRLCNRKPNVQRPWQHGMVQNTGPITALTLTSWVGTSGMETGEGASTIYCNRPFSLHRALALPHMRALLY